MTHASHTGRRRGHALGTTAVLVLAASTTVWPVLAVPPAIAAPGVRASAPAALLAPSTSPAPAAEVEWSVAPADADGPDGRVSLRHVVDPGATVQDAIAVTNLGAATTTFEVVVGDGVVGADGAFDVRPGDPVDSGTWVEVGGLTAGLIELGAGETRVLPVTISVPQDASPGDHPAGVVVGVSQRSGAVTVRHRAGVRLHLQVAGDLDPVLAVSDVRATFSRSWIPLVPGTLRVAYTLANEGNVRLGAAVGATAHGPLEVGSASASDGADELLPGEVVSRSVELEAWPLLVLSGDLSVTPLVVGEDQVPTPVATGRPISVTAVPVPELVLLVGAVGALLALRRARARRRGARPRAIRNAASA